MIIQVHKQDLLKQIGYKEPPQPKLLKIVDKMVGLVEDLLEPRLSFKEIHEEKDLPTFLMGAALKYAGAATLGPKLEKKVKQLFDRGKPAQAYILDLAGSVAITKVGNSLWDEIKQDAAPKGFKKGFRRTPGCRGIEIATQQWIFEKVDDPDLGIQLTESWMMVPRKSLSFLARFGGTLEGSFSCKGCKQYADCSLEGDR